MNARLFRSHLRPALAWVAAGVAATAAAAAALPVQPGEHLTFRVSWAVVPGAGEIKIDAATSPADPRQLVVTTTTATRGLAKLLLPFQARADSIFDVASGRLVSLHEKATTRAKPTERHATFDYGRREATYTRLVPAEPVRLLSIPGGDPVDLIMALLQTRTWDLQPGGKRDALVLFDDDFYELTIHALRYEDVRTNLGTFRTLVLEPRMERTAPKGMFKRGSTVKVWIAQNDQRLPVQFEVEFKIGTGTATLDTYRPPSAAPTALPAVPAPGGAGATSDGSHPRP
jgi:hypothetical protein